MPTPSRSSGPKGEAHWQAVVGTTRSVSSCCVTIDDAPRKPVPPVTVDTSCCRYPDAMRTTVAIDDALLVAAKLGARRRQL